MAFIDIFNFKKYFNTPSDSQVARYGHVNAVYEALTKPTPIQVTKGGFFTTLNIIEVTIDKTSDYGIIELAYDGPTNASFPIANWLFTIRLSVLNFSGTTGLFAEATAGTDFEDIETGLRQIVQVETPESGVASSIDFKFYSALQNSSITTMRVENGMKVKLFYHIVEY